MCLPHLYSSHDTTWSQHLHTTRLPSLECHLSFLINLDARLAVPTDLLSNYLLMCLFVDADLTLEALDVLFSKLGAIVKLLVRGCGPRGKRAGVMDRGTRGVGGRSSEDRLDALAAEVRTRLRGFLG